MRRTILEMADWEKAEILEQHNSFKNLIKEDALTQKKMEIMKAWDSFPQEDKKKYKAALKKCRKKLGLTKIKFAGALTLGLLVFALTGPGALALGELLGFLGVLGGFTKLHIDQAKKLAACVEQEMNSPDLDTSGIMNIDTPDEDEPTDSSELGEEIKFDFN